MGGRRKAKRDENEEKSGRVLRRRFRTLPLSVMISFSVLLAGIYCICFWKMELVIRIVLSICSCSSFDFPSLRISSIRETSSGEKRIPCLLALVISASMTGARSRPVFPLVRAAAIRISSSFAGSMPFRAGLFIHSSTVVISFLLIVQCL